MRLGLGLLLISGASACVGGAALGPVPAELPPAASLVIVHPTRAVFIFPVDTGTAWGWPDSTIFMANYVWGATVSTRDTAWIPSVKIFQARHPAPFRSLADALASTPPELLFNPGGHVLISGTKARIRAEVVTGRVVITLHGASTVARVFRSHPDSVRIGSGTPLGSYRGATAFVQYRNN